MYKHVHAYGCLVLGIASAITPAYPAAQPDLDPAALNLLKQTVGSITNAKTYSFKVVVARDGLATNDQLVTYFNDDTVTVSRPQQRTRLSPNNDGFQRLESECGASASLTDY